MNTQRLTKVLLWNIISNLREIRRSFTGLTIAFCIITAANNIASWCVRIVQYSDIMSAAKLCTVGTGFAMLLWASEVCFNMTTKTTFINYAMLPATNAEKYVANVLYQTICRIGIVVAAIIATDVLQAIVSLVMAGDAYSLTLAVARYLTTAVDVSDFWDVCIIMLFVHSTFILGGTFFRRRQFLLTCLMWVAVPFLFSLATAGVATAGAYLLYKGGYDVSITPWFSDDINEILIAIALIGMTCLCYWLSYRLFRRSQVINNKFFN